MLALEIFRYLIKSYTNQLSLTMRRNVMKRNAICVQKQMDTKGKQDINCTCDVLYSVCQNEPRKRILCCNMFPVVTWNGG